MSRLPGGCEISLYHGSTLPTCLVVAPSSVVHCKSFLIDSSLFLWWLLCRQLWFWYACERRWAQGLSTPPSSPLVFCTPMSISHCPWQEGGLQLPRWGRRLQFSHRQISREGATCELLAAKTQGSWKIDMPAWSRGPGRHGKHPLRSPAWTTQICVLFTLFIPFRPSFSKILTGHNFWENLQEEGHWNNL